MIEGMLGAGLAAGSASMETLVLVVFHPSWM
jgi:hypothetical protein